MLNTSVEVVHAVILAEGDSGGRQEIHLVIVSEKRKNVGIQFCLFWTYTAVSEVSTRDPVLWMLLRLFVP